MPSTLKKSKIAFDVGGVLSKYPAIFRPIWNALQNSEEVEVWVVTDMSDVTRVQEILNLNGFRIAPDKIRCADFELHGEACKAFLLEELGIDIFLDDFLPYLAGGAPVRLLLMPDLTRPYYADAWQTPGEVSNFGRRRSHHENETLSQAP